MTIDEHRSRYNLSCRIRGTCSFAAIWHGLWLNSGLDKLRFLKSRIGEVLRWMKMKRYLRQCSRSERKVIGDFAKQHPELRVGDVVKPVALYLPQFHTFPENDEWWGKGFTEWTNVKKARPLFEGHYQPHVPHPDVGYYDLSNVDVMRKQAAMAKEHGVYGFCFYYYHFANGKRLLEKPLDNWLAAKDIDFPFCYCWANENWTRAWDGGDKEVIMPQDYSFENLLSMMRDMLEAFKDKRYIKVGKNSNTPVLLVYRAEIIPEIRKLTLEWRKLVKSAGFDDLYLIAVQGFLVQDPSTYGMDAAMEFSSAYRSTTAPLVICDKQSFMNPKSLGALYASPYENSIRWVCYNKCTDYIRYKCVAAGWDNTPRKGERGAMFLGCDPKKFDKAFHAAIKQTIGDIKLSDSGFLFINAWNEWGEGAHLEPDMRFGYGYLDVIKKFMELPIRQLLETNVGKANRSAM